MVRGVDRTLYVAATIVTVGNPIRLQVKPNRAMFLCYERSLRPDRVGADRLFRSRAAAEILVLRHQISILRRHSPKRYVQRHGPLIFAGLYRLAPTVLNAPAVLSGTAPG
jgi:hypothetical protein